MVTVNYFPTSVQRLYRIGTTGDWLNYNDQPIKVNHGQTIYAKGIDQFGNTTRITSSYTSNVVDAIKKEVYDRNDSTYMGEVGTKYMEVDSSMQGKNIRVKGYRSTANMIMKYLDKNKVEIGNTGIFPSTGFENIYTIPNGTKWIVNESDSVNNWLYEIKSCDEPTYSVEDVYMLLTADSTKAMRNPYQMVSISYSPENVQKLYKIGTTGVWLNYINQPIRIELGQIIYAKGIYQNGEETRIISSYTSNAPNALKKEAYDVNDATYTGETGIKYMEVDSSMQGKNIRVKGYRSSANMIIRYLNENKVEIGNTGIFPSTNFDKIYTIAIGTKWISYESNSTNNWVYEIQPIG